MEMKKIKKLKNKKYINTPLKLYDTFILTDYGQFLALLRTNYTGTRMR